MPALRGELPEERVQAARAGAARGRRPSSAPSPSAASEAFFAGLAAVNLSWEAWDGDLDPELDPPETQDHDLDEPRGEALAAWALAGEDPEARRAFWRWYITEAFPAAYAVVE